RKLRAFAFISWMASARSPTDTCSPVETTTSCSRWLGRLAMSLVSLSRRLVSPAMAETTTTTSCPSLRAEIALRATLRMRSASPTEVPPYFCTMSMAPEHIVDEPRVGKGIAAGGPKGAMGALLEDPPPGRGPAVRQRGGPGKV